MKPIIMLFRDKFVIIQESKKKQQQQQKAPIGAFNIHDCTHEKFNFLAACSLLLAAAALLMWRISFSSD